MRFSRCVLAALALLACTVAGAAELRTWTDVSGQHQTKARLVNNLGDYAILRTEDGRQITVSVKMLSEKDREYLKQLASAGKANAPATAKAQPATGNDGRPGWHQWRGPDRDGISPETGLLKSWPQEGPRLVWSGKGLGKGYSSVAISGGRIYTMGGGGGSDYLIAVDANNGDVLWRTRVGRGGDPNCTPTVDGKLVFALSRNGDLLCADAETGREVWRKSFPNDFGGKMMSGWGYSESPLVDDDRLICTPGSQRAMMAALDKKTGRTIWQMAMPAGVGNRGKDGAGYSSIVISNAAGVKQYVQLIGRGVIGVAAEDGRPLWGYNKIANTTANIPTPIVTGDYVFCSTGYGDGGSALVKIERSGARLAAKEIYYRRAGEMQNHHGGMVLVGEYIYMGHGHNKGLPMCVHAPTGRVMWGPERGAGSGSAAIAYADGNLYFRYENGVMALIEATPGRYNLKGSFQIATRNGKSWPHPAIQDGKLYLRDQDALHCYDISAK